MDERHADRMRRAALLGNTDTKRTVYFQHAASAAGLPVLTWDWKNGNDRTVLEGSRDRENGENTENYQWFIKIDPPVWDSCSLEQLNDLTGSYKKQLKELSHLQKEADIEFLNSPDSIAALLDKKKCKQKLREAGLPVTEILEDKVTSGKQLMEMMEQHQIFQVFIKPTAGSGAAGVAAFRFLPVCGRMVLYTCALEGKDGHLVNTKRLRRFTSQAQIISLLDRLLGLDCVVERWYAKAEYGGFSYDLRAVMQDGQLDFLLGRLSKGPVTNLHLNNHPLPADRLGLSDAVIREITGLCRDAMKCYPGLRSAGIDILLEKGSLRPRIIEMNGQGDLIYQDIYGENTIYRHQAEIIKEWVEQ